MNENSDRGSVRLSISSQGFPVKGVGAQDRRTTTTKLVALAGNGAGVFAQALYGGEEEEDERDREIRDN